MRNVNFVILTVERRSLFFHVFLQVLKAYCEDWRVLVLKLAIKLATQHNVNVDSLHKIPFHHARAERITALSFKLDCYFLAHGFQHIGWYFIKMIDDTEHAYRAALDWG